tara:strand:+ start:3150 stop:4091 length:942 start_codon:yes stop_codon:yes gene_type:complete
MGLSKINGVELNDVNTINGSLKSNIAKFNGIGISSLTNYVSDNLEFHINANDTNSYNGTTTWTDLAGTENCTLINGPVKASADEFVAFDGVDDRGEVQFVSTDYFFGSTSNTTLWSTMTLQIVISFPDSGSGLIPRDGNFIFGSRTQSGGTRGFRFLIGRRGLGVDIFLGSRMDCGWPNTSDFQLESSTGIYEPIPGKVYSVALTMDRGTSTGGNGHFNGFLNGAQWTPTRVTSHMSQLNNTSRWDSTFINSSSARRGRDKWILQHTQRPNGQLFSSAGTCNVHEVIMYTDVLTSSEIVQNLSAYTDRYGPLN